MVIVYLVLVFAGILLGFVRFFLGPSAQDRLNAAGIISSGIMMYLIYTIFRENDPVFTDVILLYTFLGFTGTAVFSFYLERGD